MVAATELLGIKDGMETVGSGPPFQDYVAVESPYLVTTTKGAYGSLEELKSLIATGKLKEAKRFIRENNWPVSHVVRSHLWVELCRLHSQEKTLVENYYWDVVKQMCDPEMQQPQLPSFVDPQCTQNYHLTADGHRTVARIMSVVAYSYPAITYSPTIYAITSLLLHYMGEEQCYNAISALLSWKHGKFVIQTKLMYEISWRTMLQLTKKFAKGAYGNISKYLRDVDTMDQVFEQWLSWIFKHLPFTHLVRVMDCYLYEGSKVLYRVAMALLILFQKHSVKNDSIWAREASANGISSTLARFSQEIPVPPEKLLKVAFGIRALSQSEVSHILLRTEMFVKSRIHKNTPSSTMIRSRSTEGIPTSQSQVNIQMLSHTLNVHELLVVWSWLPARITMYQPKLLYTTEEHGCSLTTFYSRVEDWEPTILIVKTTTNETFGAYCSTSWGQRNTKDEMGQRYAYFGTGESFVFTISSKSEKFPWVGIQHHQSGDTTAVSHSAELFMAADAHMLTIGGGTGQAILLDEDIRFGRTETCQTFNNPPLCSKHDFECKVVEVFGFA